MKRLPTRSEVPARYTWDLATVYASEALWEEDFARVKGRLPEVAACQGTLGKSASALWQSLRLYEEVSQTLERLLTYASMRRDEDSRNGAAQALYARGSSLATDFHSAAAFLTPEILAIPERRLRAFMKELADLQSYRHYFARLRRQRAHVRTPEVESLLAQAGEVARAAREAFTLFVNADLRFPPIRDEHGTELEVTQGRYRRLLENGDQRVRRDAFLSLHTTLKGYDNTFASLYSGSVKRDLFYARARHYPSALAAALEPENIPAAVYHNLLATVERNLPQLHRYVALRKRLLGLDQVQAYDLYAPLVGDVRDEVPYEEALRIISHALAPLGEEYVTVLEQGVRERWIDVYENEGKRSGAYSGGAYDTYPFILTNYQDNADSMFTLAHELGHSLHSYFTRRAQPYVYGDYTIFVAEVASVVNETLLMEHLLRTTTDERFRLYLLNHYLENFRTTLFRQTLFAAFELAAHEKAEAGQALTAGVLSEIYGRLLAQYYGPQVAVDETIAIEWARIPHFYSAFYVYQYATGMAAAVALAQGMLKEGAPAVERYLAFLRSGSSADSIDLLKRAGVDLASPEPLQQALDVFSALLDQLEAL